MAVASDVETYLAALPADQRAALEELRRTIRSLVPEATEEISYGVPAFKLNGPLVSYGAGKGHCSFYVQSPAVMDAHAAELSGYKTSKGTVHFQPGQPLPPALVEVLVRARLAEKSVSRPTKRGNSNG